MAPAAQILEALLTPHGNILSLKGACGPGVVIWDERRRVVEEAIETATATCTSRLGNKYAKLKRVPSR